LSYWIALLVWLLFTIIRNSSLRSIFKNRFYSLTAKGNMPPKVGKLIE